MRFVHRYNKKYNIYVYDILCERENKQCDHSQTLRSPIKDGQLTPSACNNFIMPMLKR